MGRKRFRKRQCFYVCIACLILSLFSGCASLSLYRDKTTAREHLKNAHTMFEQGDFAQSARESNQVLKLMRKRNPADKALFNLGLIYAHQDNDEKDYSRSASYFKALLEDHSESPLFNEAKAWYFLLNNNMQLQREFEKLQIEADHISRINGYLIETDGLVKEGSFEKALAVNLKALTLSENKHRYDEAVFNIGLIYAHNDNPDKNYKLSMEYFNRLINNYPESPLVNQAIVWKSLLDIIEKSKQVDIELEQKKKELAR